MAEALLEGEAEALTGAAAPAKLPAQLALQKDARAMGRTRSKRYR
jgi:hypothetical protein